jgi:hypothetical protein
MSINNPFLVVSDAAPRAGVPASASFLARVVSRASTQAARAASALVRFSLSLSISPASSPFSFSLYFYLLSVLRFAMRCSNATEIGSMRWLG